MVSDLENLMGFVKLSQHVLAHHMSFLNRILHGSDVSYRSFNSLLFDRNVQYFR